MWRNPERIDRSEWVGLSLAVALMALGCTFFVDPISRDDSHLGRAILAGLGIFVSVLWVASRKIPSLSSGLGPPSIRVVLAVLCVAGWFNYFQFDKTVFTGINDYTDTAYYYTNSKYLAELRYDSLYAGALACDFERGSPRTSHISTIRDLRNDNIVPREEGLKHGMEVKQRFTEERWAAFCHDIDYFLDRLDKRALSTNFFVDHGYNPPPTWSVVGGNLTALVPVEQLKTICHADTLLVVLMFVAIGWWAGLEAMLWSMLFYTVTFSGRWPILGMAIMRFDWVCALVLGWLWLSSGRYGPAGAALAYASFNRIFPAIFLFGWLVEAVLDVLQTRRLDRKHVSFAAGAALVSALLVGSASLQYGPSTLLDSAHHLSLHNQSFSSHRIGLGTVLSYRGEQTREEINQFEYGGFKGMRAKELFVQSRKPIANATALLMLGLVVFYAWRSRRREGERSSAAENLSLVALALYCATTPQANYLNYRIVLFLWHGSAFALRGGRDAPFHALGMSLLLATEIAAQLLQYGTVDRYAVNSLASIGLLIYLITVSIYLLRPRPLPAQKVVV